MKRQMKKQILSLLDSMKEAQKSIRAQIESGDYDGLLGMLSDCQAGAYEVGTVIEATEEDGVGIVPLLEEYCETAFLLSQSVMGQEEAPDMARLMDEQLSHISQLIRASIKEQLEVLFLPYKASMWDSLESVWSASDEDPDCESYVVPIPYYEKTSDGILGPMVYEGDEFPPYVPITNWQSYSLQQRHPDIIYFHNPYDDNNHVTSVDPDYYSSILKKYTDLLVYIPYFVTPGKIPRHFCVCSGAINADKVIVQSDADKEVYVEEFQKAASDAHHEGMFGNLEDKFIPLGSPKIDKVVATSLDICDIPNKWVELIRKPDGGRKKVVLYNTSITAFLQNDIQMLTKIMSVLETFYRYREQIVLLWRPHPLMKATIRAMRPYLCEVYEKLTMAFQGEGWGIYDDTADLNRAIAISDAYYGDSSSLVALYKVTGKPIMIQNALRTAQES